MDADFYVPSNQVQFVIRTPNQSSFLAQNEVPIKILSQDLPQVQNQYPNQSSALAPNEVPIKILCRDSPQVHNQYPNQVLIKTPTQYLDQALNKTLGQTQNKAPNQVLVRTSFHSPNQIMYKTSNQNLNQTPEQSLNQVLNQGCNQVSSQNLNQIINRNTNETFNQAPRIRNDGSKISHSGPLNIVSDNWCNANADMLHITYLWVIENFSSYSERSTFDLSSDIFSINIQQLTTKWRLNLHFNEMNPKSKDDVGIFVELVEASKLPMRGKCAFSLLHGDDIPIMNKSGKDTIIFFDGQAIGFEDFLKKRHLFGYPKCFFPENKLKIICEIVCYIETSTGRHDLLTSMICTAKRKRLPVIAHFFEYNMPRDLIVKTRGVTFEIHKNALKMASPVFEAMFKSESESYQINEIIIEDFSSEVVEQVIDFIYVGKLSKLESLPIQIYLIAKKYQIEILKEYIEQRLCEDLKIENACQYHCIAEKYSMKILEEYSSKYIKKNINEIVNSSK